MSANYEAFKVAFTKAIMDTVAGRTDQELIIGIRSKDGMELPKFDLYLGDDDHPGPDDPTWEGRYLLIEPHESAEYPYQVGLMQSLPNIQPDYGTALFVTGVVPELIDLCVDFLVEGKLPDKLSSLQTLQ